MIVETKSRNAVNIPLFAVPSQLQIGIKTPDLEEKLTRRIRIRIKTENRNWNGIRIEYAFKNQN